MRILFALYFSLMFALAPAWAVNPDEVLDDPVLEERARAISAELRCVVCQNQSIDDSNADLAKDLRLIVRERLIAGDNDSEVKDYLVQRYGEFVLLRPPFAAHTLLLWLAPALLLVGGLVGIVVLLRRRQSEVNAVAGLSKEEEARIEALLTEVESRRSSDEDTRNG